MDTTFSTRDPAYHKRLRGQTAAIYSMSNIKKMESAADECAVVFLRAMEELEGQPIDISPWLQWYAFDVVGAITFQKTFGFVEARSDVDDMIAGLDITQTYAQYIGQFPWLHAYLFGNRTLIKVLQTILPNMPDPLARINQVLTLPTTYPSAWSGTPRVTNTFLLCR